MASLSLSNLTVSVTANASDMYHTIIIPFLPQNDFTDYIIWSLVGIVIIVVNLSLLAVIFYRKSLHTSTHIIMASMFISHVLFALLFIFPYFASPTYRHRGLYCSLVSVIAVGLISAINLHFMVTGLDRLRMIKLFRYRRHYSSYRTVLSTIGIIWFVSILLAVVPLLIFRSVKADDSCQPWQLNAFSIERVYNYIVVILIYVLPLIVMLLSYASIFKIIHTTIDHQCYPSGNWIGVERRAATLNRRKIILTLTMTIILYLIMWSPFFISYIIAINPSVLINSIKIDHFNTILKVAQYIAFTYPAVNPIIYALLSNEIRTTIIESMRNFTTVAPIT